MERLDNGYRLFPDCRKYISRLPSEYGKRSITTLRVRRSGADAGEERRRRLAAPVRQRRSLHRADTGHVTRLPIAEADKAAILGSNARKMFGLK